LEQRSLLAHMGKAHSEALDVAANMACTIIVQMRQCLLNIHGLIGLPSVQEQLVASPYCGVHVFGPQWLHYQQYLHQSRQQVQLVTGNQPRGPRPRFGARPGQSMIRMSQLDPPQFTPRAAAGTRAPFRGSSGPAGRGSGRGQNKKQKRH
jgi:hypothetical protein